MESQQTLKKVLAIWKDAVDAYSTGDLEGSIEKFLQIEELSARMLYNIACAYTRLNKTTLALQCLSAAVKRDKHLAIAFFQKGVLNLKQDSLKSAIEDLNQARILMRGNNFIDYKPLGMYTKLGKFEILYNLALAYLRDNHRNEAEGFFTEALHDADIRQRKLLISALEHIQDKRPNLIMPIEITATSIFTPPKSVVENLERKNVIGSAKVVSATDKHDTDPSFNGMKRVEELKRSPLYSRKLPRSPLMKMKQFLRKPRPKSADLAPPRGMRAAHSTGDIRSLSDANRPHSDELSHSLTTGGLRIVHSRSFDDTRELSDIADSPTSSIEDFHVITSPDSTRRSFKIVHSRSLDETGQPALIKTRQTSIDEACSTSASCIAKALSSNCEVTIVVTPPASDSKDIDNFLHVKQSVNTAVCNSNATETCRNRSFVEAAEINNNINANSVKNAAVMSPNTGRKPRPPPPSYPPPPLPSKVLFTV